MKTLFLTLFVITFKVLDTFGNNESYLKDNPLSNQDSTQIESTIRFEVKNLSAPYILLNYSLNYLTSTTDTLIINNGICEKKYRFPKEMKMEAVVNGISRKIFIVPGHQLTVSIDMNNKKNGFVSFQYQGDYKIANDYLQEINTTSRMPLLRDIGKTITEEGYLTKIETHYNKLDSVYIIYKNLVNLSSNELMQSFFATEKTELTYHRLGRLINFIDDRKYKGEKAENFFKKYIQPTNYQKEEINLNSESSLLFFTSYLPDYVLARVRESKDSSLYQKIGHYAYLLKYVSSHYDGEKRSYTIARNLHLIASNARRYLSLTHYPSIDSLMTVYDPYLNEERKAFIRKRYYEEIAPSSTKYTEKDYISDFELLTISNDAYKLNEKLTPITVIDLWASWCSNCIEAFPNVEALQEHYINENKVSFLKISLDDKEENWRKGVKKLQLKPEESSWVSGGMKSDFAKKFDIKYLPRYIILNQKGQILKLFPPDVRDTKLFKLLIDDLLKKS